MIHTSSSTGQPRQDLAGVYAANGPEFGDDMMRAHEILPDFAVREISGLYPTTGLGTWGKHYSTKGAWKSPASSSNHDISTKTYAIEPYRHKSLATKDEARLYGSWFDAEKLAAERVRQVVRLDREVVTAALVFNTGTFATSGTNTLATSTRWDASSGTPVSDVQTAKVQLQSKYGVMANTLIITYYGICNLHKSTQMQAFFTDTFGPTLQGQITPSALQSIFGLEKIIVVGATKDTTIQPTTPALSAVWDEDMAMVCRTPMGRNISEPCLGRTFRLETPNIRSWPENDPEGSWVLAEDLMNPALMDTPIGCLITNTKT